MVEGELVSGWLGVDREVEEYRARRYSKKRDTHRECEGDAQVAPETNPRPPTYNPNPAPKHTRPPQVTPKAPKSHPSHTRVTPKSAQDKPKSRPKSPETHLSHTQSARVTSKSHPSHTPLIPQHRQSTRLNPSHEIPSRMPSSA